jgi:hypothetical protein
MPLLSQPDPSLTNSQISPGGMEETHPQVPQRPGTQRPLKFQTQAPPPPPRYSPASGTPVRSATIVKSRCLYDSFPWLLQSHISKRRGPGWRPRPPPSLRPLEFLRSDLMPQGPSLQDHLSAPGGCTPVAPAASLLCPHCCGSKRPRRRARGRHRLSPPGPQIPAAQIWAGPRDLTYRRAHLDDVCRGRG